MDKDAKYIRELAKIEFQYKQRLNFLKIRIRDKYEGKIEKEIEKKSKRIEKRKEDKIHNLKVDYAPDNRLRKKRVKDTSGSDYATACKLGQLFAKLRDTDENGNGECICCPGSWHSWDELEGGHYIPKSRCKYTALVLQNINAQSSKCNASWGGAGRFDAQTPQIEKKRGIGTIDYFLRIKNSKIKTEPREFIKNVVPLAKKLLASKRLPDELMDKYTKRLNTLEKKYG